MYDSRGARGYIYYLYAAILLLVLLYLIFFYDKEMMFQLPDCKKPVKIT